MSTLTADRLYGLLPAVYRLRDDAEGGPLRALVGAVAQQFAALEENIDQLYDDQFIETCAEWVAPYIGDLIGYRPLHGAAPKIASPRAEVANTIAYRRRKGTALMLEQLAGDVTDWPARAVEYFELLTTTQCMKHLRPHARATADLRDEAATFRVGGGFDGLARTPEMRRPASGAGRYNITNIGILLWRLRAFRLTDVPLVADPGDGSGRRFRMNPLGADLRLFRRPATEADIGHLAEPVNMPEPLSVRLMALAVKAAQAGLPEPMLGDDYGPDKSVVLRRADRSAVAIADIRVCDLRDIVDNGGAVTGWNHEDAVSAGTIGIDPERGRVLIGEPADGPLRATFHFGAARAIGGGDYARSPAGADLPVQQPVADAAPLQPALDAVAGGGRVLIGDCLTYSETPRFKVDGVVASGAAGIEAVVAANDAVRPMILAQGAMALEIGPRGRLVLDGLVIAGGALHLADGGDDEMRELVLRDCTLVPGLTLEPDGSASAPGAPSLIVDHRLTKVTLERCIVGPILAVADARVSLVDCVIDAGSPEAPAYAAGAAGGPGASLTADGCTIVGKVHTREVKLASDSLFFARLAETGESWPAPLIAARRQEGCMRFCYVAAGSTTPRRYHCVPDAAHPAAIPLFTSLRYGDPAYAQLSRTTDPAIRQGAHDGGEMGVLHALMQPQRETNLHIRLDEYLRFGLQAGVFYMS